MESMPTSLNLEDNDFFNPFENRDELMFIGLAVCSYILALISGTWDSGNEARLLGFNFDPLSLVLWLLFGGATLFFLYMAFFDMWQYGFSLLLIYFCAGLTVISVTEFWGETWAYFVGTAGIIGALALIYFTIIEDIASKRHALMEVTKVEDEDAFSLGDNWYLLPAFFYIVSLLSFFCWYKWYKNDVSLIWYFAMEVLLIIIVVVLMWIPQNILFYAKNVPMDVIRSQQERAAIASDGGTGRYRQRASTTTTTTTTTTTDLETATPTPAENRPAVASRTWAPVECSRCSGDLRVEKKGCSHCGHVFTFGWCGKCQDHNLQCPHCQDPVLFSDSSCQGCGKSVSRTVECPDCHRKFLMRRLVDI